MINKKFFLIITFAAGLLSLPAQENEEYRLKALSFFCSHKNEIIRITNTMFGDVSPIFLLDIRMSEEEEFYIDSNRFNPDSLALEQIMKFQKKDDFIINEQLDSSQSTENQDVSFLLCDCVYCDPILSMFMDIPSVEENPSLCKREYGLSISRVINYKGLKYVVLKMSSFFKTRVDKMQFCIVEFSNKKITRCGIGNALTVD